MRLCGRSWRRGIGHASSARKPRLTEQRARAWWAWERVFAIEDRRTERFGSPGLRPVLRWNRGLRLRVLSESRAQSVKHLAAYDVE